MRAKWVWRGVVAGAGLCVLAGCGDTILRDCVDGGPGDPGDGGPAPAGDFTIVNAESCENRAIVTDPGVFVVRVTPPRWPARIERVRFVLARSAIGITCDHAIPLDLLLFKGNNDRPAPEPSLIVQEELAGDPGGDEFQTVTYEPDEPIELASGENLFVGFAMPPWTSGEAPRQCLTFCGLEVPGDWAADSASPPFNWFRNELDGLGLKQVVEIDGETL